MYNRSEKPQYVPLSSHNPNGSSLPPPPLSTPPASTDGFAYSTLLRRAEDETILRTSHQHHKPFNIHSTKPSLHEPISTYQSTSNQTITPSAQYTLQSVQQVIQQFNTHPVRGLSSQSVPSIRAVHGPNEFQVDAQESILKKFLAQFYESPLNLLLLASAGVSVLVGNTDDAISIAAAIIIVVTGMEFSTSDDDLKLTFIRSGVCLCSRFRTGTPI